MMKYGALFKRALLPFLMIVWVMPAYAATEIMHVYFMPLHEAAQAVRTQLSNEGKVIEINSKRMLLIDDKDSHIKKAKALLKRLDQPASQLTVQVKIEDVSDIKASSLTGNISASSLTGGWVQLLAGQQSQHASHRSRYQLRVSANKPGRIEAGVIQSLNRETRLWLSGYGVIEQRSVDLIPIHTGFYVRARLAGNGLVHVRIVPWMKREKQSSLNHPQDMLIELGSHTKSETYLRYNTNPSAKQNDEISIAGAATELTIPLGEEVSIAAVDHEAQQLGEALLARYAKTEKRQLVMRLKVSN